MAEQVVIQETKEIPPQAEKPKRASPKRRASKKADKTIVVKSKRKTTVARAYVKPGKGIIRINGRNINSLEFAAARNLIMEAVAISEIAKEQLKKTDIQVNVRGGGVSSQIQATRGVIARALVAMSKSDALKGEYLDYDRSLMVDDPRRVEPKKFKGPKARARFQTSYR